MRFDCRRMKSPLASSSICSRSICGLNFQSKVSNVLGSSNRASRIRYSTDRSRRAAACWPNSRSRNMRWDRVSLSARSSTVSRSLGAMGIPRILKWLKQRSRRGAGVADFFIGIPLQANPKAEDHQSRNLRVVVGSRRWHGAVWDFDEAVHPDVDVPDRQRTPKPNEAGLKPPGCAPRLSEKMRDNGWRARSRQGDRAGDRWITSRESAQLRPCRNVAYGPVDQRRKRLGSRVLRSAGGAVLVCGADP